MKTILFDMDGTIFNTAISMCRIVNEMLEYHNKPKKTAKEIQDVIGYGIKELIIMLLPDDLSFNEKNEAFETFVKFYNRDQKSDDRPYDGIIEVLEKLKNKGYVLGIVTNKIEENAKEIASRFFPGFFSSICGAKSGISLKPHPYLLEKSMKELGSKKRETIFVGDTEIDAQTAHNANIEAISVTWGYRTRKCLEAIAYTNIVDDFDELLLVIDRLLNNI